MKCYLSVDLDYWLYSAKLPTKFFKDILTSDIPKTITETHDGLITSINKCMFKLDEVVNVDFHSDITSLDPSMRHPLEKNEGVWANFIKNSKSKNFIWSPPVPKSKLRWNNYCHADYLDPFLVNSPDLTGWKNVEIKPKYFPLLKDCVSIGISISPGWTPPNLIENFAKLFKTYANSVCYIRRGAKTYLT